MVKKKIAKKVIKKRSKIKIKNEEKQRQKITNYDKDKTIHYKKQKPWQTHCHLCHKLISRTHYHSHIKHNHKNIFTGNLTEGDNNNTYIHSSSYSYFKKEDNGNNVADIPKMKKWNTNIFLEKSNKNNILSNDFYSLYLLMDTSSRMKYIWYLSYYNLFNKHDRFEQHEEYSEGTKCFSNDNTFINPKESCLSCSGNIKVLSKYFKMN